MKQPNKEDIIKKWSPILDSIGVTGSKAQWMSEYAEMHSNNDNKHKKRIEKINKIYR